MSNTNFLVWKTKVEANYCNLSLLENVEEIYDLYNGQELEAWQAEALFKMDNNHPKGVKLIDNVSNLGDLIVVSKPLRDFLGTMDVGFTQFLPVSIIDHKGRIASRDYFVVNPNRVIDCIDLDLSVVEWNDIDPELIADWETLVLDENRIPEGLSIFRLKFSPRKVLIYRSLAESIATQGFTGIRFVEPSEVYV
jgi:hypothetical protein